MTAPRGNTSNSTTNQALAALAAYIDELSPALAIAGATIIRVDKGGVDATGLRGRLDRPFLTIGAAMGVALSGDIIQIGAGIWAENVVIPATLTSLSIFGTGYGQTFIQPALGIALAYTALVAPAPVLANLTIKNVTLWGNAAGGAGLAIDGTLAPTTFGAIAGAECFMQSVRVLNVGGPVGIGFTVVNNVNMLDCIDSLANTVEFMTVSSVEMKNCIMGVTTFHYELLDLVKPSGGIAAKHLYNTFLAGLAVHNLDDVFCDSGCVVSGAIVALCEDDGLGNGQLEFHGIAEGAVTLNATLGADRTCYIFDHSKIIGVLIVNNPGLGAFLIGVNLRNAVLDTIAASGITVGNCATLDMIEATFSHTAGVLAPIAPAAANPGSANRSIHSVAVNLTGGADAIALVPPYNDVNYRVVYELSVATTSVITINKAVNTFDATSAGLSGGARAIVLHE